MSKFTSEELLKVAQGTMPLGNEYFEWRVDFGRVYKVNIKNYALHEEYKPETNHEQWRALAEKVMPKVDEYYCIENTHYMRRGSIDVSGNTMTEAMIKFYLAYNEGDNSDN